MLEEKGYVTVATAAEKLGRHITSIYKLIEQKKVEGLQIGRSRYIKFDSLVAYANKESPNGAVLLGLVTKKVR
jgi:excisionase family DNA binding protein